MIRTEEEEEKKTLMAEAVKHQKKSLLLSCLVTRKIQKKIETVRESGFHLAVHFHGR